MIRAAGKWTLPGAGSTRLCGSVLTALCMLLCIATANAGEPESSERPPKSVPASAYPERWCIKTFLNERRQDQPVLVSRLPAPGHAVYTSADLLVTDVASAGAADSASLMNRLRNLHADSLMTLWKGRSRSLVLGVQKGGYLGVRMDEEADEQ